MIKYNLFNNHGPSLDSWTTGGLLANEGLEVRINYSYYIEFTHTSVKK